MCAGGWLSEPLPAAGTYLDPLLRLGEGGLGGRFGLQGLKSFQTESRTSHLRSPVSTCVLGRRDEDGRRRCRRRRSALPAPSRAPSSSPLPSLPLPRRRRSRWRTALAAGGRRRSCSQHRPGSAARRVPGGSERGGAGGSFSSPPSLAAPPLPGAGAGARRTREGV